MPEGLQPDSAQNSPADIRPATFAWQPLTPRGVAAFARTTLGRLLLVEFVVALVVTGTVVWFVMVAWFPTVRAAIRRLPEQGVIRKGELNSPRTAPEPLAEGRFLSLVLATDHSSASFRADVSVVFHKTHCRICSVFGCLVFDYPKDRTVQFNRPELIPWWGAWEPILLGVIAISTLAGLMLSWALLATLYFPFVRLLAFFKDRDLDWGGSWRVASAALIPGALLLALAIFLYGVAVLDLVHLLVLAVTHLVMGWIYLIVSPLTLPRLVTVVPPSANPFSTSPAEEKGDVKPDP